MLHVSESEGPTGPSNDNRIPTRWQTGRILVLGMTYPHYSKTYIENVCTGGILEDTNSLVRIHPLPQRYLEPTHRLRAFQWITVEYQKHECDPRPESIRVHPDTIRHNEWIGPSSVAERRSIIERCSGLLRSVEELKRAQVRNDVSLAVVSPAEILGLRLEKRRKSEAITWRENELLVMRQQRMEGIVGRIKPIDFPDTRFMVKWRCDDRNCDGHEMGLESWDIHEAWRKHRFDSDRENKILTSMHKRMNLATHDVYFYLGSFRSIQWNFGLMGICSLLRRSENRQTSFGF